MLKMKIEYILTMVLFGSIGLFVKNIDLPSAFIVQYRSIIGALFLGIYFLSTGKKIDINSIKKNKLPLLLSGSMLGLNWVFLFEAYQSIPVNLATIIYYFAPVFVFILSSFIFKEKRTLKEVCGMFMALFGMMCIYFDSLMNLALSSGVMYALASAILYACIMIVNRFIDDLSGMDSTLIQLLVACVVMSIYCVLSEGQLFMVPHTQDMIYIVILGVVHTGIAYSIYFFCLQHLKSIDSALLSYIDPGSALLLAFFMLNESLSMLQLVGVILMFSGCIYVQIKKEYN